LQENRKMSVFTVLWWALFSVALLLKLYYYVAYRKHKRMVDEMVKNS
jgi:hypothetical protein